MANFCRYCGNPVRPVANFCPACGKSLAKAAPKTSAPTAIQRDQTPLSTPQASWQEEYQRIHAQNRMKMEQHSSSGIRPASSPTYRQPQRTAYPQSQRTTYTAQPIQQKNAPQNYAASPVQKKKRGPLTPLLIIFSSLIIFAAVIICFVAPGLLVNKPAEPVQSASQAPVSQTENAVPVQEKAQEADPMQNVNALIDYAKRLEEQGNYEAAAQIYSLIPQAALEAAQEQAQREVDEIPGMDALRALNEAKELQAAMEEEEE